MALLRIGIFGGNYGYMAVGLDENEDKSNVVISEMVRRPAMRKTKSTKNSRGIQNP